MNWHNSFNPGKEEGGGGHKERERLKSLIKVTHKSTIIAATVECYSKLVFFTIARERKRREVDIS